MSAQTESSADNRLTNLDVFRAIAALTVCLFHFHPHSVFRYGHYGVDVFFVISGFIIPASLLRSGYQLGGLKSFLVSRFVRLYPAYFLAGLMAVVLWYVSAAIPGFKGQAPSFTWQMILNNLLMTCDFLDTPWIIPVFWTLAVEAQYYLLIALSFPLLAGRSEAVKWVVLAGWILVPFFVGAGPSIFSWTALFGMGLAVFALRAGKINLISFYGLLIAAGLVHWQVKGPVSAGVGVVSAVAIMFCPAIKCVPLVKIGVISYSLYLIHVPLGGRMINLATRFPESVWTTIISISAALVVSLVASAVFFHVVEKPSHSWSRAVRKRLARN